ncbi:MAG: hypothetical protein L0H81_06750 [Actinomyces sp.]|nr:hypothetical protein [Actinomyces sp.]
METLREAWQSLLRILADSVRVLGRHWPVLVTVCLAGAAGRGAMLWLSVWVSNWSALLAMLLLPFASISVVLALAVMLGASAPSLPALHDSLGEQGDAPRIREDLVIAVQVLVPFLAVYASQGFIRADLSAFLFNATTDEWLNQGFAGDFAQRVDFASDAQALVLVLAALVLRKTIAGFDLARKNIGIAGFAGYLEALWLVTLASFFTSSIDRLVQWVQSRTVIVGLMDALDTVIEVLGPIGIAVRALIEQIGALLSSMGSLVIVPVAWLAVGATIYGSSLPRSTPLVTSEQMTRRIRRIPDPLRRAAAQVTEPVVSPVRNTLTSIGRIAAAGVVPMVFLCLLLAGASQLRVATTAALRGLIGPLEPALWTAVTPWMDVVAQCVYTTVMVALLAAAVSTIISRQREVAPVAKTPQDGEDSTSAPGSAASVQARGTSESPSGDGGEVLDRPGDQNRRDTPDTSSEVPPPADPAGTEAFRPPEH